MPPPHPSLSWSTTWPVTRPGPRRCQPDRQGPPLLDTRSCAWPRHSRGLSTFSADRFPSDWRLLQVDVRGKSKLEEVDKFLRGLKMSRSRTISLGLLRSVPPRQALPRPARLRQHHLCNWTYPLGRNDGAAKFVRESENLGERMQLSATSGMLIRLAGGRLAEEASEDEKSQLAKLAKSYSSGKRCGVAPEKAVEFYLLPQCPLASGLLGAVQSEGAALTELPPGSMLLVSVHSKVRPGYLFWTAASATLTLLPAPCCNIKCWSSRISR